MKNNLVLPYYYINELGINASLMLDFIIKEAKNYDGNIAQLLINKSKICEKSVIKFIQPKSFDAGIDLLHNLGFLVKGKKDGRMTKTVFINLMNISLFELMERSDYEAFLEDFENEKYFGKVITIDRISEDSLRLPDFDSFLAEAGYLNFYAGREASSIKPILDQIITIYNFDMDSFYKNVAPQEDGRDAFFPSEMEKKDTFNFEVFLMQGASGVRCEGYFGEVLCDGGVVLSKNDNLIVVEESNSEVREKSSLKEEAKNNLEKFYEYMKISETMRKPIEEWSAKDFVSYFYCGMAYKNNGKGDFVFPNFGKCCSQMNTAIKVYGKKMLNKVIYSLIKNTDDLRSFCGGKEIYLSMSIFSVDWLMVKICDYVEKKEQDDQYKNLTRKISSGNLDNRLEKTNNGDRLKELRQQFNNGEKNEK